LILKQEYNQQLIHIHNFNNNDLQKATADFRSIDDGSDNDDSDVVHEKKSIRSFS